MYFILFLIVMIQVVFVLIFELFNSYEAITKYTNQYEEFKDCSKPKIIYLR